MKKIIAWNVNGLRSLLKTDYLKLLLDSENPDILCLGEIKIQEHKKIDMEIKEKFPQYKYKYWSVSHVKKGYSGTAIFMKKKPLNITYGLKYDDEGRVITIEFKKYFLIHCYTPNSGQALQRLNFRVNEWEVAFKNYLNKLQQHKPIILCGDLNVAHNEIDLKNPKTNHKTAGFTDEERRRFNELLHDNKLVDSFRILYPDKILYSYWSYMKKSREKNVGWRIDYFLLDNRLQDKLHDSTILTYVLGSDHAPIKLEINI
jgi:exodeoxyribonuclease-3